MENLKKEFKILMAQAGKENEHEVLEAFCRKYENNEKVKVEIAKLIKEGVVESGKRIDDINMKMQLKEVTEIVSLAYIARHYFRKTKSWLSQRINAHTVNGKPAKFTDDELNTLNFALKDIGKKIGSISVHR
jgi:hypothetical protein